MLREKLSAHSLNQKRKSHLVFALASVAILLFFAVAFLQAGKAAEVLEQTRKVAEFQERTDQLLVDLLNVETGVQGFMLTGEGEFLEPYRESIAIDLDQLNVLSQQYQSRVRWSIFAYCRICCCCGCSPRSSVKFGCAIRSR